MRVFRPSSTTARRNNAVYYVPVWEGVCKMNRRGFHAVECQLLSNVSNRTFSCSLWHKSRVEKIALISFLTPAEWALRSCGCLKWSVAVTQGSLLLLLNERGCFWWLTWLIGSLLFWNDRKAALKVLHASPPCYVEVNQDLREYFCTKVFFFFTVTRCDYFLGTIWRLCGNAFQECTNNNLAASY